ncbi:MAG: hypothetical protein FGM14_15730 [Flavobacteriales bacterium]|nr:hypothetical protein [Flavobacteriales bacterium]
MQQNTLGNIDYEITNYLGNVNVVISDRKIWNITANAFKVVTRNYTDYFPFGMEISSRTFNSGTYKYGYIGLENDNEVSGNGNSYTTDYRQYDSRLGRWKSCDPKRHWFPSMGAYCYASNSPIAGKDDNGLYTIFVNGYTGDGKPGNWNEAPAGYQYWRGSKKNPSEFINAAHDYFGDGFHKFVDGSGDFVTSTAWTRQRYGREIGKQHAEEIKKEIKKLNSDSDPNNDVKEINFVTHSMGAAVAEGMIEVFMEDEELKKLLKKGEIIHFSACDGDKINISRNSKSLKRTQLNYLWDGTLIKADFGSMSTGGYKISGVKRFGVIQSTYKDWGKESDYDFHFRSKTFKEAWDFLKILDMKTNGSGEAIKLYKHELDNWDHRDGTSGQTVPNDAG